MKRGSTIFLRAAVIFAGLAVLALCIFWAPWFAGQVAEALPEFAYIRYAALFCLLAPAIPFFIALYQAMKLLGYIDGNRAFSVLSVKALRQIKRCALIISVLFLSGMPIVYLIADQEDAPGLIIFGLIIVFAPVVIATFAAVLQRLLQEAIDLKSENDLTV